MSLEIFFINETLDFVYNTVQYNTIHLFDSQYNTKIYRHVKLQ